MTMLPEVLTVAQVAELLDCSADTIEQRTRDRQLPGLQYGRSWVYPREALLDVLRQQALAHVRPAAPAPASPPPAPKVLPIVPRPPQRGGHRQRGRTPAPLPDPPVTPT